jgi:F-type H+-transporting ATPase subunit alpha
VLDAELFNRDIKPAVDVGLSVSRVGGEAQTEAMKTVAGELRLQLSQFEEVARFARLGTEVDEATRQQIERGTRLQKVLTQPPHQPMPLSEQVVLFYAVQQGLLEDLEVQQVSAFEDRLLEFFQSEHQEMMEEIELKRDLTEEMQDRLDELLDEFAGQEEERSAAQ